MKMVRAAVLIAALAATLAPVGAFAALGDCIDVLVITYESCYTYRECRVLNPDGSDAGVVRFRFQQCV